MTQFRIRVFGDGHCEVQERWFFRWITIYRLKYMVNHPRHFKDEDEAQKYIDDRLEYDRKYRMSKYVLYVRRYP